MTAVTTERMSADDREVLFALGLALPNLGRALNSASAEIKNIAAPYLYSGPDDSGTPIPLLAHHAEAAFHGTSRDLEGALIAFLESGAPLTDALREQLVSALKRQPGETGPRLEIHAAKGKRKSGSEAELIADLRERLRLGEQIDRFVTDYMSEHGRGSYMDALEAAKAEILPEMLSAEAAKKYRTVYRAMRDAVSALPQDPRFAPALTKKMGEERWIRDWVRNGRN